MSNTVENRVVDMTFRNDQFGRGVAQTIGDLDKLKGKLNFDASRKSAEDLQGAVSKFSFSSITSGAMGAAQGISAMSVIGVTALATLTSKAISSGLSIAKSLSVGPALDGLREYETNLNSIQTVLANTSAKGTTLEQVNGALEQLNEYSDKTIYNFAEMAKNIGTFTAAGVDLDTSVSSIKGIANLAAVSGSTSEQASTAMYQLSQALAAGKVSLMDWNSVVNAGMGGQVFQDALKETARAQGVAVDDIIKKNGSFRDSLQDGWITSDILNKTLMKFTGDMSAEQLKAQGYTEEQIASIIKLGETATDAATKVKTASQLAGTLKEAMGSGWSKSFQIIVGDFEEAKAFFTGVNDVLSASIGAGADARNSLLQGWKDLGGRQVLIQAFWNILNGGLLIISKVKAAFREVFPARTAENLFWMTTIFEALTQLFYRAVDNMEPFLRILKGIFAAVGIGIQFFVAFGKALYGLWETFKGTGSGLVDFIGRIADWLVAMKTSGDAAYKFEQIFENISYAIIAVVDWIKVFASKIGSLFSGINLGSFGNAIVDVFKGIMDGSIGMEDVAKLFSSAWDVIQGVAGNITKELAPVGEAFRNIFGKLQTWLADVVSAIGPLGEEIANQFGQIKDAIFSGFGTGDFSSLLEVLTVGFLGGIILAIKKFMKNGLSLDLTGGLFDSIKDSFEGLTGVLTDMQTNIKADTLLKIAGAIGIITLSIIALSNIDTEKLGIALGAIAVGMGQLVGAMAVISMIGSGPGIVKIPIIAASMALLAGAVLLLSFAVKSMSKMSWEDLGRGMAGVAAGLALLTGSMSVLSGISGGILRAGLAMVPMAAGLWLLSEAVKAFAEMDWLTMGRGMAGVATGLVLITGAMRAMPPSIFANALGLVIIAGALKILATAVKDFGGIPWDIMGKGMVGIAGALVIIAGAMRLMPKNILAQSVALVAVGIALNIMGKALMAMGGMSWEEIGKGLATLAGSLAILAAALNLMSGTMGGAIALAATVLALAAFVPILITLGGLDWETILTALGALAALFAVLGLAGLLLAPIAPVLLALAIAMGIFGVGVLAFGAGALLTAQAITLLVAAGSAGLALLIQVVGAIVAQIPAFLTAVATGIIGMIDVITANAPKIIAAMVAIAGGLLDAVVELAPKIRNAIGVVVKVVLDVLKDNIPKIVQAGFDLLVALLKGIADNIGNVVKSAADVVVNFINGLKAELPRIIQAGFDLLVAVVDGIVKAVKSNLPRLGTVALDLVDAIVDGFINGLGNLAGYVKDKAMAFFSNIWNGVLDFFGVASPSKQFHWLGEMLMWGMANGIDARGSQAVDSAQSMGENVMSAMTNTLSEIPAMFENLTDIQPTITPVLDLSNVQSGANQLNGMFGAPTINPDTATLQAQAISRSQAALNADTANMEPGTERPISFLQTIHSPSPLSTVDIYRDTRSMLAMAKEELKVP